MKYKTRILKITLKIKKQGKRKEKSENIEMLEK